MIWIIIPIVHLMFVGLNIAVVRRAHEEVDKWGHRPDLDGFFITSLLGPIFTIIAASYYASKVLLVKVKPTENELKQDLKKAIDCYKELEEKYIELENHKIALEQIVKGKNEESS